MTDKNQEVQQTAAKKGVWTKIFILLLIVAVIIGIWVIKSATNSKRQMNEFGTSQNSIELPNNLQDANFVLEETGQIDFEALSEYELPVLVDYGSDSCIPCKEMAPALKILNSDMYGKAFVKFVDVWKYTDAASNIPLQVIPTQVIFNADGTPFIPSDELATQIQFDMYSHKDTNEHIFTVHQGGLTEEQLRAILKEMGVE